MIVEVTGAGFHNMGAELMLRAAATAVASWDFVDDVAISFRIGTSAQRRGLGIGSIVKLNPTKPSAVHRSLDIAVQATPAGLKRGMGIHHSDDGGALLDASGFAFGDQWGAAAAEDRSREYERYAQRDRPIVLLPQAFGPFTEPDVAARSRRALNMADLVFARDPDSLRHVEGLELSGPTVGIAPDFTNLLEAPRPDEVAQTVVVIPNYRVPEKVESIEEDDYVRFLNVCIDRASGSGFEIVAMAHEAGDVRIAERLARSNRELELAIIDDPLAAKTAVGGSWLTISSRYHGAVNSLSQGVPTIGTSWSHKYEHLFAAYQCEDGLWPIDTPDVAERLDDWLDADSRHEKALRLEEPAARLKAETEQMWAQVEATLQSHT